jgi:chemotaxis protein MotB
MKVKLFKFGLILMLSVSLTGCTFIFQKGRRSDIEKIEELSGQLDDLNRTKELLAERLAQEIKDKQVKLQMMEKGLVITFLADVLFDSGKSVLKPEVYSSLDKVARVLKEDVPQLSVGIEGHTDNQPIKLSGWKSNWELSTARALSVLHYLVDEKKVSPQRVSAIGYGEYRPVATNDTGGGRQLNRRVEVVILPQVSKTKESKKKAQLREPQENLK